CLGGHGPSQAGAVEALAHRPGGRGPLSTPGVGSGRGEDSGAAPRPPSASARAGRAPSAEGPRGTGDLGATAPQGNRLPGPPTDPSRTKIAWGCDPALRVGGKVGKDPRGGVRGGPGCRWTWYRIDRGFPVAHSQDS